jgi:hypothetical protein
MRSHWVPAVPAAQRVRAFPSTALAASVPAPVTADATTGRPLESSTSGAASAVTVMTSGTVQTAAIPVPSATALARIPILQS